VQADAGDVERTPAGLDLYGPGIDFLIETMRSQHASEV
jgi:hypothetical protein